MSNKKFDALRQGGHTSRMVERAAPPPTSSVADRLKKLDALEQPTVLPEVVKEVTREVIVEKLVEKLVPERIPLDAILDRAANLRPVYEDRARALAGNIALFGIIQPIAVDLNNRLLAGDHRRRALKILREVSEWPDRAGTLLPDLDNETLGKVLTAWRRYGYEEGVPVHRVSVDALADPAAAKAIELSENTQRENFTKDEVKNAYKELVAAGYRHTVGRPKKGEKAIGPQLELLYGKSSRAITKYIAEVRAETEGAPTGPSEPSPEEEQLKAVIPDATLKLTKKGAGAVTIPFATLEEFQGLLARLRP
jgi:hypothetical protein